MIQTAEQLAEQVGVSRACQVLGVTRSSLYRARQATTKSTQPSSTPKRALSQTEKAKVRQLLNSERFQDCAPREVYATLLDEGEYLCHWRSMYRILAEHDEVRERRNQLRHPKHVKPQLLATQSNQLWSWDITKLLGPAKWTYYYLYVLLDVFSRYVVAWLIAQQQSALLAEELITASCAQQNIRRGQLTIHADRGSPMIAKSLAFLLADLGVTKTHSRPHTANDNPYSEAQFKTLKYRPDYPERFGSQADARAWAGTFFNWYNHDHHHSALALLTPADVHYGRAETILQQRQQVLQTAYQKHPDRFVKGPPQVPQLPQAVWINPPKQSVERESEAVAAVVAPGALSTSPQPNGRETVEQMYLDIAIRA